MILRSCYIENYGALVQKNIDFKEDLTVFCEENGYGKTTLVSFLKAMFYGLPSYKKTTVGFPERQHFYPFNGGKFGGNLTFEHEGKVYRVERFFDKKSDTKDECRIFCDSLETDAFGEKGELLGRTLFKLDEDSFVRTVFVEDLATDFSMTTDLFVALNRLVDDTDDDRNFEAAIKRLNDRRKELHTDRGSRGLIPEKKAEIRTLEERIGRFKNVHQKELEKRYEEKREAHRETEEKALLLNRAMQRSYWDIYDDKLCAIAEKRKEFDALHAEYPHGMPTAAEREKLTALFEKMGENLAVTKQEEEESSKKRLSTLTARFEKKTPSQEELSFAERQILESDRLKVEIETLSQTSEADRMTLEASRFQKKEPSEEEIVALRENAKLYRECQTLLQAENFRIQPKNSVSSKSTVACAFGGALFLLGVILSFVLPPIGFALVLVGAVSLTFGVFDYSTRKKESTIVKSAREAKIASLEKKTAALRESLRAFLSAYNYPTESDPSLTCERFFHDFEAYRLLLEKHQKAEEKIEEKRILLTKTNEALQSFFADYPLEAFEDSRQALRFLSDSLAELKRLQNEQRLFFQKKAKADEQVKEILDLVKKIYLTYEIPLDANTLQQKFVSELKYAADQELNLKKTIADLEADAEKHKKTYQLEERTAIDLQEPLEFYQAAVKEAQTRESEIESRIRELEFELEELPELENELVRTQEILAHYEKAYQRIAKTVGFLQNAEQKLMDRYVTPVRDSFCAYAKALESALGEDVRMDKEYRISFERGGELRSDKHLSAGQHAVSALCMRLALAEQIYGENLPFLILDDPFVHLDEKHLKKALQTVGALSKQTQIFYFTCHRVRAQFELTN